MFDENKQASKDIRMHQEQHSTNFTQESETESKQDFDYEYEIQELLQDERLLEYVMEDKERPEKRRKLESDKGDGVLPVPSRSPRVVLNKIKLKEDVLERLRKIKKLAQAQVKGNSLSTVKVPEKEIKESKTEQLQDKSTDFESITLRDGTWNEQKQKQKRKREEDKDGDQEKQELSVTKVAKIISEAVAKETPSISESFEKEDADRIESEEQNIVKRSEEDSDKEKDQLALRDVGYTVSNSEEQSVSIATPSKGDEVAKAAQNYAKSGAQTEPKQDKLLNDEKIVVVVTEVLEEGNYRTQENSLISEQEPHVDNNNCGEQEETLSDGGREEDEEDYMSNAIFQLIKDVVKNRTEYFESALLRENEKLEERVSQLEKQNALLHKVSYRLDYALKEITKKRQEASQSRISRGTQVNMNLHLSRTSTSKSTPIEIDVPEEEKNKTSSPQLKSNPAVLEGNNTSRSPPSKSRSPIHSEAIVSKTAKEKAAPPTSSSLEGNNNSRSTPSKLRSSIHSETIVSKTAKEKAASPTSSSSMPSKHEENRPTRTQPVENKSSARSEGIPAPQSEESTRKVSIGTQHEQQDLSSNKKLQQGMGHFRLSPSYKRAAQQKNITEDVIETGHFRITPTGLEPRSICSSQRTGSSSGNESSRAQVTTRPSSSPRAQKMDTSVPRSSPFQSNSNSSPLAGSSSSFTKGQSRSSSLSQATVSSMATKNAAGNALEKRSQLSSTLTVPTRSSPSSKPMTQEKRNLSTPPSLINTKTMRVENLERRSQTSGTSMVTTSRAPPSSSGQHCTSTKEPSRTVSTERINPSQQRKEPANDEEPDIVIVSPTIISSPKEQSKKVVRNERVGSQGEISGSQVQNRKEQAQVRIHRVENQSLPSEKPPPSNKQRTEVMKTPQQRVQQHPQGANHQPSSSQQNVYRSHDIVRVSTAPRDNVPPLRSNEPQQRVRYIMREDGKCLQVVHEQPRQVDKGQHDPRQHPRYVVQDARGQPQVVREQVPHPTDKAPTAVRYDPNQPPRYVIQEGPQHRVHEGPRQPLQGVPQQQTLPPGAIVVHQQHQGSAAGSKAVGPLPPPIGIQDVRTQPPQPYAMQQQQHIIVKQHPPVQTPQHPHQYQHAAYQYQQPQHPVPQQQNVPRTQYYPQQNIQQVPPPTNNQPTGYQPRPTVLPQEYVTSSRIPPERATVRPNVQVGVHVNARHPPPDVVYQPGVLEGSTVRPPAPMPPHGFQPRPAYVQQGRQPQVNNQGIPRPMMEQSMPRPSNPGGARYVQTLEQQRVQERRSQGQTPPERTQPSTAVGQRDSVTRKTSPPKPTASIAIVENGIVLSWNITTGESTENIECYELFACQDDSNSTLPPIMWKKIGVVKALPLPMACTLTQFSSGSRYQFAVRAVDTSERAGPFSDPCVITLKR